MAERSSRTTTGGSAGADLSSSASSTAEDLSAQAKQTAKEGAGILRAGKDEAVREAQHMVRDIVEEQRSRAASQLGGMADALHKSARDLEQENKTMAKYTDMAAERLDDVARYLRQANWNDMMREAESFARRQPYWFIGGAVAAGFLAARFVKSAPSMKGTSRSTSEYVTEYATPRTTQTVPGQTAAGQTVTPGYGQSTTSPAVGTPGQTARTGDLT